MNKFQIIKNKNPKLWAVLIPLFFLLGALILLGIDLWSKLGIFFYVHGKVEAGELAYDAMDKFMVREGSILNIYLTFNDGMAFGIQLPPALLVTISLLMSVAVVVFFIWRYKKNNIIIKILCVLVFAGTFGNLIDRFFFVIGVFPYERGVIDFIDPAFMRFAVFNFADSYLVIGLIAVIIYFVVDAIIHSKVKNNEQIKESHNDTNVLLTKEQIEEAHRKSLEEKNNE